MEEKQLFDSEQGTNNEKKDNNKKKLIIGGAIVAVAFIGIGAFAALNTGDNFSVKESVIFELGDPVSLKPSNFLKEGSNFDEETSLKLSSSLINDKDKYTYNNKDQTVVSKGKDYLEVGKYKVLISYEDETKASNISVKDTTSPTFKDFLAEINIEKDAQDVDLTKYFEAQDLSEAKISVDDGNLDISKEGSYKIKVTAEDKYGNKSTKESTVNVLSTKEAEEKGLSKDKDGEMATSKATQEKIDKGQIKVEESKPQIDNSKPDTGTSNSNTGNNSSSGNTGSSSNTGNNSNSGSNSGNSGSSNNNTGSNTGGNTKPSHTHHWVEQFKTVHHDAVYEDKYVVDQAAYDEQVPRYEMVEHRFCSACNQDVTSLSQQELTIHKKQHVLNGENGGHYSKWIQEVVGYDTVHHDEVGHTERVLVKEAWDEQVSTGYKCSECGATK